MKRFWVLLALGFLPLSGSAWAGQQKASLSEMQVLRSAFVSALTGQARRRPRGAVNWQSLSAEASVFPGDTLFVSRASSLTLQYVSAPPERPVASVRLSEHTLFRVQKNPPLQTKLRRRFAFEQHAVKNADPGKRDFIEQVIVRNVVSERQKGESGAESAERARVNTPRVQRDVRKLELDLPKPNTTIFASQFPTTLLVKVKPQYAGQNMWGYLWSAKDSVKPVWTGFSQGEFSQVPIARPGHYEIQVMLDDDTASSSPVTIEFRKVSSKKEAPWGRLLPALSAWSKNPSSATLVLE